MSVQQEKFKEIADAIREKTGSTDLIKPSEFANKIDEVYEAGQQSEYDRFWDGYQEKGKRRAYWGAFAERGWNDSNLKPKYPIIASEANYMFFLNRATVIPQVEFTCGSLLSVFQNLYNAHTIQKLVLRDNGTQTFPSTFNNAPYLANIIIEGVIGKSVSFQWSPLTAESAISVITHLKDYSGTDSEFVNTLTLSSSTKTALDNEGATSPNGNTWDDYITDIGWVLN